MEMVTILEICFQINWILVSIMDTSCGYPFWISDHWEYVVLRTDRLTDQTPSCISPLSPPTSPLSWTYTICPPDDLITIMKIFLVNNSSNNGSLH